MTQEELTLKLMQDFADYVNREMETGGGMVEASDTFILTKLAELEFLIKQVKQ